LLLPEKSFTGDGRARNAAVQILREVRARYGFALVGYVIMPEHVRLLIGESAAVKPAKMIQVFKQRLSRRRSRVKKEKPAERPTLCQNRKG